MNVVSYLFKSISLFLFFGTDISAGFTFIPPVATWLTQSHHKVENCRRNEFSTEKSTPLLGCRRKREISLMSSLTHSERGDNEIKSIKKDVVIIGGGLAGLSIGLSLAQSGRQVTILEKEERPKNSGSFAAAGMLAPQSERLPDGPLLDLCLASRNMYTSFVRNVESMAKNSGKEGEKYLTKDGDSEGSHNLERWEVGFQATGGFLAPAFAGDSVATWAPPNGSGVSQWLDEVQVHELEPQLHPDVIGGWWFPEDASVDARRLTCSLRAACVAAGVHIMVGSETAAASLDLSDGVCKGVYLADGRIFSADSVIVANGSWMRELLPVPVSPHKGQSFSLRMPPNTSPILSRVLFAQDTYIVPKADGRIIVGATVEPGSFDPSVTPAGMMHCINNAVALVPELAELPIDEMWSGLRPTTPDKAPILGKTLWKNLVLAGGYWRNGVLLAPKTAQLISDLVNNCLSDDDEELLNEFSWDRFTTKGGGAKLAATSRYISQIYPVHKRASGVGVSKSVGTELGFYSDATAAKDEREKDRKSLFVEDNDMSEFEAAASLGKKDASAFSMNKERIEKVEDTQTDKGEESKTETTEYTETVSPEGLSDALTVGSSEDTTEEKDMSSVYEMIRENKARENKNVEMGDDEETKPDPGFRIYYVEKETQEKYLVPPYTSPGEMDEIVRAKKQSIGIGSVPAKSSAEETDEISRDNKAESKDMKNEPLYDGYSMITDANSSDSRLDELAAMKKARMKNRIGSSEIDVTKIGAMSENLLNTEN